MYRRWKCTFYVHFPISFEEKFICPFRVMENLFPPMAEAFFLIAFYFYLFIIINFWCGVYVFDTATVSESTSPSQGPNVQYPTSSQLCNLCIFFFHFFLHWWFLNSCTFTNSCRLSGWRQQTMHLEDKYFGGFGVGSARSLGANIG